MPRLVTDSNLGKMLHLHDRCISVLTNFDPENYLGCRYLCENESLIDFEYFQDLAGNQLIEDFCVSIPFRNESYPSAFSTTIGRKNNVTTCLVTCGYYLDEWKEDLNLLKFFPIFIQHASKDLILDYFSPIPEDGCFFITIKILIDELVVSATIQEALDKLEIAFENALGSRRADEFIADFNFPPNSKNAYLQYLIYFGQFLSDLGIESSVSIDDSERETSLRISPVDKESALETIHYALATYLSLPSVDLSSLITPNKSWEAEARFLRLNSTIDHLKSQLSLERAIGKAKDAQISLLDTYISNLPENSRFLEKSSDNHLEPFEGIRITKYKGMFFEIDLPKIVRRISSTIKNLKK